MGPFGTVCDAYVVMIDLKHKGPAEPMGLHAGQLARGGR
jgi:hypothetical protein